MSTGERGRRAELDGVRGVAVLLVIAAHAEVPLLGGGGIVGVTMFFALSGYLITSILLTEQDRGPLRYGAFYARRAYRLLPALLALIVVALALGAATVWDAGAALLYVGNWIRAMGGDLGYLGHVWSLAIEEQFYLLWPLLLGVLSRRVLAVVAAVGVVASVALRAVLWDGGAGLERVYFGADTRADAVLLGCLLAIALHGRTVHLPRVAGVGVAALVAMSAVATGAAAFVVLPGAAAVVAVTVVAAVVSRDAPWLAHPVLTYVGRRSYALYLWHVPVLFGVLPRVEGNVWVWRAALVAVAFGLAELSWRFVEAPAMRTRRRATVPRPVKAIRAAG